VRHRGNRRRRADRDRRDQDRRQLVEEILAEAEDTDAGKDRAFGERRGDELPRAWANRKDRRARIAEALRQLDAGEGDFEARLAARKAREEETGRPLSGRKPSPNSTRSKRQHMNTTDPDSRVMRGTGRAGLSFIQAYNAQAAATEDQLIIAAEVTNEGSDVRQLAHSSRRRGPRFELQANTIRSAPSSPMPATGRRRTRSSEQNPSCSSRPLHLHRVSRIQTVSPPKFRKDLVARVERGELTAEVARETLGVSTTRFATFVRIHRGELLDSVALREEMEAKLAEERNAERYARRKHMIEPIFGNIKANRGYRSFSRRGMKAAQSEWRLICAAHNLLKLRKLAPMLRTV
jgi:Transposase DDE domain